MVISECVKSVDLVEVQSSHRWEHIKGLPVKCNNSQGWEKTMETVVGSKLGAAAVSSTYALEEDFLVGSVASKK